LPEEKRGSIGYNLISSAALTREIQTHAHALGIQPDQPDGDLHHAYFERLASNDSIAMTIAAGMGQSLGFLLLALHRGDQVHRDANPEKDAAYWDYWSAVRTVYIGGGLAVGQMGQVLVREAQAIMRGHVPDYTVEAAQHPQHLGILGAARYVPDGDQAVVFDFGSTWVKRARAYYENNQLRRVQLLGSVPSGYGVTVLEDDAAAIFERFVTVLVEAYQDEDAAFIPASIASYVAPNGQPYLAQGGVYMQMSRLSGDLPTLLSETVSERIGRTVSIRLLHDGTAAASFYAPMDNSAVITLGTAIGSGYPVARANLRGVHADLAVG